MDDRAWGPLPSPIHHLFTHSFTLADTHIIYHFQQVCNKFLSSIQNRVICYAAVSLGPGAHNNHLGEISFLIRMFRPHTRPQITQMVVPAPVFSWSCPGWGWHSFFNLSPLPTPRDPTHACCTGSVVLTTGPHPTSGWGRSPGEGNGNLSSILAWETPRTVAWGGLQSLGLQKSWTRLSTEVAAHTRQTIYKGVSLSSG